MNIAIIGLGLIGGSLAKAFKETGEHQIIKIKNISSGIIDIDSTDCVDSNVIVDVSTKLKVNSGDVLIAMTGAEIGKLGVIPKNDKSAKAI